MTIYVSEHARAGFSGVGVTSVPLRSYTLSSASTLVFPGTGAQFLRVVADATSLFAQTTGMSTGAALTVSTAAVGAVRISANAAPEFFPVVSTATPLFGGPSTS